MNEILKKALEAVTDGRPVSDRREAELLRILRPAVAAALEAAGDRIHEMILDCGCSSNVREWADDVREDRQ